MISLIVPSAAAAIDVDELNKRVAAVIPDLPFYGVSKEGKSGYIPSPALKGEYSAAYDRDGFTGAGLVPVTFCEPAGHTFGVRWNIELADNWEFDKTDCDNRQSYLASPFGEKSCAASDGSRGAIDITTSGDPYEGSSVVIAKCPSKNISIKVTSGISIHAPGCHGPRTKEDVIKACKDSSEKWALEVAKILIAAACETPDISQPVTTEPTITEEPPITPPIIDPPIPEPGVLSIPGTWSWPSGELRYIHQDGSFESWMNGEKVACGTWGIVDDKEGRYVMSKDEGGPGLHTDTVWLEGNSMIVVDPNWSEFTAERISSSDVSPDPYMACPDSSGDITYEMTCNEKGTDCWAVPSHS